jgi:hypothetical protein
MGNAVSSIVNPITKIAGKLLGVEQPDVPQMAAPTPPTAAETPSVATPNVQAAAQAARRRERTASGRAATMLSEGGSGGGGGGGGSANVGTKKLLGQ